MGGAFDGAGNQQREKTDKNRIVDKAPDRFLFAAVNIDHITHSVECIERDAHRQRNFDQYRAGMKSDLIQQPLGFKRKEVIILEDTQHQQVIEHTQP